MPFQFEQYRNPYVQSISDLMQEPGRASAQAATTIGNAQAQGAINSGNALAQAAAQRGAAYVGAVNQIGQTIGAIPQQIQQQKIQALQTQNLQQQVAQGGRAMADMQALDKAYATPGGRQAIIDALPGHLRPSVQKQFTDADEAAAKVQETQLKVTQAQTDYLAGLAGGIRDHGYEPSAAQLALSHAKQTYAGNPEMLKQIGQIEQAFQSDPASIKPLVDNLISVSEKQRSTDSAAQTAAARVTAANTGTTRLALETPKIKADTQKAQQEAAGTQPMSPAQIASNEIARGNLGVARSRLSLEQQKVEGAKADVTELTPEGLDAAAMNYAKTGQLPPLGMGDKQTRKKIINRAAALMPGLDLAVNRADFTANQASLKNVTTTLDSLTAFEKTSGKNLDQFLSLADKIPDTGVPWLNTPIRTLNEKLLGSDDQSAANAARTVALREIARVTNDPKLSGVLSDSARHEVSSLSPENATFAQIKHVAQVLKQDMANVHTALSEQRSGIETRIKGAAEPDIQKWERGPDGKARKVGG